MHWFRTDIPPSKIIEIGNKVFNGFRQPTLRSQKEAWFGRENDTHVHTVAKTSRMHDVHMALLRELKSIGATPTDPDWVGEKWNPHVTTTREGNALTPGMVAVPHAVSLVQDIGGGKKKVIAKFDLPPQN
jgi:hypothetical protein